ncbi:MAG: DUF4142 domain-containing protein [Bacteroidota bacterium]
MKRLIYTLAISGTVLAFQSCSDTSKNSADASDSTAIAMDSMSPTDTSAMAVDQMDIDFANKAAIGGMAEVDFGKLAQEKAVNAKVKDFANMMVMDHGKANGELMAIAGEKNITLPATLDAEHMKKEEELKSKSGADFDKLYVAMMVEGHKKTLALMQDGSEHCKDSALKGFATKTAPVVKAHLDMITKIQSELK